MVIQFFPIQQSVRSLEIRILTRTTLNGNGEFVICRVIVTWIVLFLFFRASAGSVVIVAVGKRQEAGSGGVRASHETVAFTPVLGHRLPATLGVVSRFWTQTPLSCSLFAAFVHVEKNDALSNRGERKPKQHRLPDLF